MVSSALLGCAIKGSAIIFAVLAVFMFIWLTFESMVRNDDVDEFDDDDDECSKFCLYIGRFFMIACYGPQWLCVRGRDASILGSIILDIYHLLFLGTIALVFNVVEHVPNNFAA